MSEMEELQKELARVREINDKLLSEARRGERLLALANDPDIRMVMEMKERGEDVKVLGSRSSDPPPSPDDSFEIPEDLDDMKPSELLEFISKNVGHLIGGELTKHLTPVTEELAVIQNERNQETKETVKKQVDAARSKYSDFDDYREQMLGIRRENPGLSIDELYHVAKARGGSTETNTEDLPVPPTEKPSSTSGKGRETDRDEERKKFQGRRGFKSLVDEGMVTLDETKLRKALD